MTEGETERMTEMPTWSVWSADELRPRSYTTLMVGCSIFTIVDGFRQSNSEPEFEFLSYPDRQRSQYRPIIIYSILI